MEQHLLIGVEATHTHTYIFVGMTWDIDDEMSGFLGVQISNDGTEYSSFIGLERTIEGGLSFFFGVEISSGESDIFVAVEYDEDHKGCFGGLYRSSIDLSYFMGLYITVPFSSDTTTESSALSIGN